MRGDDEVVRVFTNDADAAAYRRRIFEQGASAMKASIVSVVSCLPLLVALSAGAQQLSQPRQITPVKPLSSTAPQRSIKPQAAPATTPSQSVASDPAQRSQAPSISAKGPASDADKPVQAASTQPQSGPLRVTDGSGKLVSGAVQIGPNRVMDPTTGRSYNTIPDGNGQRIVEPRSKP
jgi:hypothetical protein